jgi:methylmalonyl-CoA mutase N-terminal domain/subunit
VALRTQQIIAFESGVANTVDPVAGSYAVEALTNRLEADAEDLLARIDQAGGTLAAIETGLIQREIHAAAYRAQLALDSGAQVLVGVNRFQTDERAPLEIFQIDPVDERRQTERTRRLRAQRDPVAHRARLNAVAAAARDGGNLVPPIMAAAEAHATVGEIADTLRGVFGEYREASLE